MLQVGGELDLGEEALGADHGRELGAQELERDLAVVPEILGQVDRRHPAGADLAFDPVAVGKRYLEPAQQLGHVGAFVGGCLQDGAESGSARGFVRDHGLAGGGHWCPAAHGRQAGVTSGTELRVIRLGAEPSASMT